MIATTPARTHTHARAGRQGARKKWRERQGKEKGRETQSISCVPSRVTTVRDSNSKSHYIIALGSYRMGYMEMVTMEEIMARITEEDDKQ